MSRTKGAIGKKNKKMEYVNEYIDKILELLEAKKASPFFNLEVK